jgi:UDP-N-acetylmuramoyl-L-alanyl-D-glutamate--2,6-diaminopimelate ligase
MAANTPEGQEYEVICDRPEAIARSVELAFPYPEGAVVCLLAKGDETRQHEGDLFVPCETDGDIFEREVAKVLAARG